MSEQVTGVVTQVTNTDTHAYFIAQFADDQGKVQDVLGLAKDLRIVWNHFCLLQPGDQVEFVPEWNAVYSRYNAKEASVDIAIENRPDREVSQMAFVSKVGRKNQYFCTRPCGCRLMVRFEPESPRVKIGDWISHTIKEDVLGRAFAADIELTDAPAGYAVQEEIVL